MTAYALFVVLIEVYSKRQKRGQVPITGLIRRFVKSVFTIGLKKTVILTYLQIHDFLYDFRFRIKTAEKIREPELGYKGTDCVGYGPYWYRNIYKIFNSIQPITEKDVFLDYGCGKGRVIVVASTYPFQKVLGVELSTDLCAIASENINRSQKNLVCKNIQVVNVDATYYSPPEDVTHFFFYNPFGNDILSNVFDAIHVSLVKNPRDITVIYTPPGGNPQTILDDCSWLRKRGEYLISPRIHNQVVRIYSNK